MDDDEGTSILKVLDSVIPAPVAQFDAFPKLPSTYRSRSRERGFLTVFVAFAAFLLVLNDLGEFIWGWPNFEFFVDHDSMSYMNVNVDMVLNMPCLYLSVDLKDVLGDRLHLTGGIRREDTFFDVGQATALKEHSEALSARQAIALSRRSRGILSIFSGISPSSPPPLYRHVSSGDACRISGSMEVKKVTGNLHITTLGHGYSSYEHVDHNKINLSHVITEFSFGPYFPDIIQPLDHTYELTHHNLIAYQYFIHVVPTTYIAPRSTPLQTNQYSVTNYNHQVLHGRGKPGIFFKFDVDPLHLKVEHKTTTFTQLMIRCVGVIGGVFVCTGFAVRITYRAVNIITGASSTEGTIVTASGVKFDRTRGNWASNILRARPVTGLRSEEIYHPLPAPNPFLSERGYNFSASESQVSRARPPSPYAPAASSAYLPRIPSRSPSPSHRAPLPLASHSTFTPPVPETSVGLGVPVSWPGGHRRD